MTGETFHKKSTDLEEQGGSVGRGKGAGRSQGAKEPQQLKTGLENRGLGVALH